MKKIENRKHFLSSIVEELTCEELCIIIAEIDCFRKTGVLSEEKQELRKINRRVADVCGVSNSETMRMTEDALLFEAARRFYNQWLDTKTP